MVDQLVDKLEANRATVRTLLGDSYAHRVGECQRIVAAGMALIPGRGPVSIAMEMAAELPPWIRENTPTVALLLAAAYELAEAGTGRAHA